VAQPTRTAAVATPDPSLSILAERLPLAENVGDSRFWRSRDPRTMLSRTDEVDKALGAQGLAFTDRHLGNLGTVGGRPQVIDPGALTVTDAFRGGYNPVAQAGEPALLTRILLDSLGGQRAMQIALAEGRAAPRYQQPLGLAGLLAGSSLGGS
jgi:hypothetical protein